MGTTAKDSTHNQARQRLLEMIGELSAAGIKRLPGVRQLCGDLGVSFMTVNKVVKRLALEGRIESVPSKGNYIVDGPRRYNLGLFIGHDNDPTFLSSPEVMEGILHVLARKRCFIRVLQAAPERAAALARERTLDGCLWYLPENSVLSQVRAALAAMDIPALPIMDSWSCLWESDLPFCHVATDYFGLGRARAEFLLRRGHRKIARFNSNIYPYRGDEGEGFQGFVSIIPGYNPDWSVPPGGDAKIAALLDQGEVTAAVVNGGEPQMRAVLQTIDRHRNAGKIELLVDYVGMSVQDMAAAYPRAKVVGVLHHPGYELGVAAATALMDCLERRVPLGAVKVSCEIMPCEVEG